MNLTNTKALFKKYPKLFIKNNLRFGFECDDGWYDLINGLAHCIQSYIDQNKRLNINQPVVSQIKEKYGGLRFYTNGIDNELIRGMIWFAESYSYQTCELCGQKGTPNETGWIKTLCKECKGDKK